MKALKLSGSILLMVLLAFTAKGQKNDAYAVAGVKGNWVICGDALPKQSAYEVWRQSDNAGWVAIAQVKMPASQEEMKAGLYNLQKISGITISIEDDRLQSVWQRITDPVSRNAPPELQGDLPLRAVTGTAWYDATAEKGITYRYKVRLVAGRQQGEALETNRVKFPAEKFRTDIRPFAVKPLVNGLSVEFEVADKGLMTHCKVLRSYYLRTGFGEVHVDPVFSGSGCKTFIQFNDETAVPKIPYTYVIVPLDGAGNEGFASPEAKVFNVADKSIAPSVYQFRAHSDESKKAIRLSWQLDNPQDLISVDVYKSKTYDGTYHKIAVIAPSDTIFFDYDVSPVDNCFYTIKLNGRYESSPASPRIPGILKATETNPMPPLDVQLKQAGNKVTLSWKRFKSHTHAYFIYRADGSGQARQLGAPLVSDSLNLNFTDILPQTAAPAVYTYRVADENTSYVISPQSQPLYAYSGSELGLPIPVHVTVRGINDHTVNILWQDLRPLASNFSGYRLYRRVANGKPELVTNRVIPANVNICTDSTLNNAGTYFYSLVTVGRDGKAQSSPSLETGYTVDLNLPAAVMNIKVLPVSDGVLLHWDNTVGQTIRSVQVFRAVEGAAAGLIATLPGDTRSYTDKLVTHGTIYYYYFLNVNARNVKSAPTDPVGVHVR